MDEKDIIDLYARVTNLERRYKILTEQLDRLLDSTTQIAENFIELSKALNVPIKKDD